MPSTPTARNRLEKQAAGENLNTWGAPKLNTVIDLVDASLDGWTTKALTGNYTLTSANYASDESRPRVLKFTGAGVFTVTVPSVEKWYHVWNATTGALTITAGAGDAATLAPGEIASVICDASNVKRIKVTDYGADNVSSTGVPTSGGHLTNKAYVDGLAFAATNLPGQNAGTVNQFVQSDGATASWVTPTVTQISGAAPLAAPSFTGGVTIDGGLTLAGTSGISGNLAVTGDITVGGGLNVASFDVMADIVPFAKWKGTGNCEDATELTIPLDDSFEEWEIRLRNITMSGDGYILATISFDGGETFKTSVDDYMRQSIQQTGSGSTVIGTTRTTSSHVRLTVSTGASAMSEAGDGKVTVTSKAGRETRVRAESFFDNATDTEAACGFHYAATNLKSYGKASHVKMAHSLGSTFSLEYSIYGMR